MTPIDDPSPIDITELDDRLNDYNVERTGIADARYLSIFLRTPAGDLYAGLHGHSWGGCCEIKLLWVAEPWRGTGVGTALLASAEAEAIARGCQLILLATHSFQAPAFYRRHGYAVVATMDGYPIGHSEIVMEKQLP
jgi:GNAT superfamily N-acetyltransferase